jgi:hypothetical protein
MTKLPKQSHPRDLLELASNDLGLPQVRAGKDRFTTWPLVDAEDHVGDEWDMMATIHHFFQNTLWLFNIAMGNGPFIDDLPIKTVIFHRYVK